MIASAILAYSEPAPPPVRWVEHPAGQGAFVVEYQLDDGRIVPIRFHAGDRVRFLMTYTDGGRLTVATRIDAPPLDNRSARVYIVTMTDEETTMTTQNDLTNHEPAIIHLPADFAAKRALCGQANPVTSNTHETTCEACKVALARLRGEATS